MKATFAYLLAVLTTGAAVLVNVEHADAGTGPRLMAGTVPVVLLLCAVLAHLYRTWSVRLPVLGVAVSSFAVSAVHTYGLAREYHEVPFTAALYPAVLELGMTAAIMALAADHKPAESNAKPRTRPAKGSGHTRIGLLSRVRKVSTVLTGLRYRRSTEAVPLAVPSTEPVPPVVPESVPVPDAVPASVLEPSTDEISTARYADAELIEALAEEYRSTGAVLTQDDIVTRYRIGKTRAGRIQRAVKEAS